MRRCGGGERERRERKKGRREGGREKVVYNCVT